MLHLYATLVGVSNFFSSVVDDSGGGGVKVTKREEKEIVLEKFGYHSDFPLYIFEGKKKKKVTPKRIGGWTVNGVGGGKREKRA